jgi:spore germination protein KC
MLSIALSTITLTGCFNYNETDSFAIASGFAIDKAEKNGKFHIMVEIVNFKGEKGELESKLVETDCHTIFDGVRKLVSFVGKKIYWGHARNVIINQDLLRDQGIVPFIDWILRDNETRLTMSVIVSKDSTAKQLLQNQSLSSPIKLFDIDKMLENDKFLSMTVNESAYIIINNCLSKGTSLTLPAVKTYVNNEIKVNRTDGIAIFKEDKLVGFLDGEETKIYLFIKNNIDGGLYNVSLGNGLTPISFEISESKTNITPMIENGEITMNINVDMSVMLAEIEITEDLINEPGNTTLTEIAQKQLEEQIKGLITKVQSDYGTDIFGFGRNFERSNPKIFKDMKDNWNDYFKNVKVNVSAKINIRSSAKAGRTISLPD